MLILGLERSVSVGHAKRGRVTVSRQETSQENQFDEIETKRRPSRMIEIHPSRKHRDKQSRMIKIHRDKQSRIIEIYLDK